MTYTYTCDSKYCQPNWETQTRESGWKTSCCHKCSNPECGDHKGGCTCELKSVRTDKELLRKIILKKYSDDIEEE
ncbi:MAG TPA: hypothetical protein QF644_04435 [Candidatus Poseidoniaceae archaeon]|nr:hypothetical protein [Candidatus Poseidoniaceae archaeon]